MTIVSKNDFKKLTTCMILSCVTIVENKGNCEKVSCVNCPFFFKNRKDEKFMDMCCYLPHEMNKEKFVHAKKLLDLLNEKTNGVKPEAICGKYINFGKKEWY